MNAHSWYIQTGAPTIRPTHNAIFRRRISVSATPRTRNLHLPSTYELASAQYGPSRMWKTHCEMMKPTIRPATIPSDAQKSRFRSSRTCSISVMEPSAACSNLLGP
jgi:hypothetical protein